MAITLKSLPKPVSRMVRSSGPMILNAHETFPAGFASGLDNLGSFHSTKPLPISRAYDATIRDQLGIFATKKLSSKTDTSVFELGCGDGETLKVLLDLGFSNYTGMDLDHKTIMLARRFSTGALFTEGFAASYFPNPPVKYGAAIVIDTLSFLQPLEMVAAMANLHDMLNPSAPVFIRMAEGQNCAQMMEGSSVWLFRANKSYIWQLLNCTGFANPEMVRASLAVSAAGTQSDQKDNFLYIFTKRDDMADYRNPS